jgi:hypothetical protein
MLTTSHCRDDVVVTSEWIDDVWYRIITSAQFNLYELHAFQLICKEADRIVRQKPSLFWFKHPIKLYTKAFMERDGLVNMENIRASSESNCLALTKYRETYIRLQFHDTMPRVSLLLLPPGDEIALARNFMRIHAPMLKHSHEYMVL